jgi:squalene-hopene/tetraprenyl-beta-curcumene cyclase
MLVPGLIYRMSSWTRAIVIALSVVHAADPCRPVPAGFRVDELRLPGAGLRRPRVGGGLSWHNVFLALDRGVKWWERHGSRAIRRRAIRAAERWMLERAKGSGGLGAIYPPMMYHIMALDVLGYAPDHSARWEALRQFERLMHDEPGGFFFEPCFSPVWDTAIAAYALGQAGSAPPAALGSAARWLAEREIRRKGDWSVRRPATEPSGWAFEYNNDFYPDIDDTAMVLLALKHARATDAGAQQAAQRRAVAWLLAMQSSDGGWAAFDVDNNWEFLSNVPFADHNAMIDPTCADITGRVMEGLVAQGVPRSHAAIRMGRDYLVKRQEDDGSWYGRWGVAYVYGTCFALRGLAAAGENEREAHVLRAAEWLRSIQNADGGWGESCASYDNGYFTPASSTPSQTAWALMGLLAAGDTGSRTVLAGIEHLVETQNPDGSWTQDVFTGSGFPRVFYLNYHMYRDYFPLMALSMFLKAREGNG